MGGGGGGGCILFFFVLFEEEKNSFCDTQKRITMITNLKAMSFGSSGSRSIVLHNRSFTSLAVPTGGVNLDIA